MKNNLTKKNTDNEKDFKLVITKWISGMLKKFDYYFRNVGEARKFLNENEHEGNAKIYHPNGHVIYQEEKHPKHHLKHEEHPSI